MAPTPIADIQFWMQSFLMLRGAARTLSVVFGGLSVLPALFMMFVAWGEWRCGVMGPQIAIANLFAAIGLSASIMCVRQTISADQRFSIKAVFVPWTILGAVTIFVLLIAPHCPFPSR